MPAVHLESISYRYSTAIDVLRDATLHLGPGWSGIVGANGSGKTTLLRLLAGELEPNSGSRTVDPVDAVVVLCPQRVDEPTDDIFALAGSWEGADAAGRSRLGLEPADLDRWDLLSAGERKRWQIGGALARRPDVLLLDEPTNHLDADARTLLLEELGRFGGLGVVVSHDRTVLDELTERTIRIDGATVSVWNAAYTAARDGWLAVEAEHAAEYERRKRERARAERRASDLRRTQAEKRAAARRAANTVSFKDIDARSAGAAGRRAEGDKAAGAILAAAVRAADRAGEAAAAVEMRKTLGGEFFVDYEPASKRTLTRHAGPVAVEGTRLVEDVDLAVERGDRIWLRGANGAGKTTLIHRLVDAAAIPRERILLLDQDLGAEAAAEVVTTLRALPERARGSVLAIVAALGVDPAALLASDEPSPGEVRKLAMAIGLGRSAWLVVLDEPTNHLDLPSIERLERTLAAYPGALLLATHDERFATSVTDTAWVIAGGRLRIESLLGG